MTPQEYSGILENSIKNWKTCINRAKVPAVIERFLTTIYFGNFMMRTIILLGTVLILQQVCLGQTDVTISATKRDRESFIKLTDSVIKKEVAFFTTAGSFEEGTNSTFKTKVNEIPLLNCTDSSATFLKGSVIVDIYSSKFDTIGHDLSFVDPQQPFLVLIDNQPFWGTDGGVPKERIRSVIFTHEKYQLILPDSAIAGLYEPNFCYKDKKTGKLVKSLCNVFRSVDKRRVYIYMLNSDGAGGYEVTWVIQDGKYYTRIVDYGF